MSSVAISIAQRRLLCGQRWAGSGVRQSKVPLAIPVRRGAAIRHPSAGAVGRGEHIMKKIISVSKNPLALAIMSTVLILFVGASCIYLLGALNRLLPQDMSWRKETTPLPAGTIRDICKLFEQDAKSALCEEGKTVYADEFYPMIADAFPQGQVTYEEVHAKLGAYEYYKGPLIKQTYSGDYYEVEFDLRGDRITYIRFYFDKDNKVTRKLFYIPTED